MTTVDYRGQTTIITGASSGIGAEFARALAGRGSGVVLLSRRLERLEKLAEEVDRSGLAVTSLVNNAGFGTFRSFHKEDAERLREEINVNVASVVDISREFIGRLRAAGTGVLVNVASMAAYQPLPNMAVYAASKAFVLSFTEALWQESLGTGLRVLLLSPGATRTEFFDVVGTDAADGGTTRRPPGEVVATALRALDRSTPPPSVVDGRLNSLMSNASRVVSRRRDVLLAALMTRGAE